MRASVAGLPCVLALTLCALGCDKADLSAQLREEARAAVQRGQARRAEARLEQALRFDPQDVAALEALLELRLRAGRRSDVAPRLPVEPRFEACTPRLANLLLRYRLPTLALGSAVSEAERLRVIGGLEPGAQSELVDALAACAAAESTCALPQLPRPFVEALVERLLSRGEASRAAPILARAPSPVSATPQSGALLQRLLAALYASDWPLDLDELDRLTRPPMTALEYLGQLELHLRRGDERGAALLEPPESTLGGVWGSRFRLRWGRHALAAADPFAALAATEHAAPSARDEALRRALRCAAYLLVDDLASARHELSAWLKDPTLAAHWVSVLATPELARQRAAIVALRREP